MAARTVLQQADITRALTRISHEILESNHGGDDLVLLGIPTRGVLLARRLGAILEGLVPGSGVTGALDVTMYRDDLSRQPTRTPSPTNVPAGGIDGKTVVLVDDVLYSGSHDPGRPRRAERPRPAAGRAPRRARRPWPPRAPDPRRLRRQEPAERPRRTHQREAARDRRRRPGRDRRPCRGRANEASALGARPRQRCGGRHPGSRRGHGGCRDARGSQAADPARSHRREPVLRGLHPHPAELRGGGEAPRRGRHHLQREGLERLEGREPQGHRRRPSRRWGWMRWCCGMAGPAPRACSPTAGGSTPPS